MEARAVSHAIMYYPGSFIRAVNGSQARALSLLSFLHANFDQVTVYALGGRAAEGWRQEDRDALAQRFPAVTLVVERSGLLLALLSRLKKALLLLAPQLGKVILPLRIPGQSPLMDNHLAQHGKAVLCVNYVDNLTRLNGIDPARTTVETHDIQFLRRSKGTRRRPYGWWSLARLRMEFGAVSAVAAGVGITRNETYLLRNMAPNTPVFYVPEFHPAPCAGGELPTETHDLLFIASANVINERGIRELFDQHDVDLSRYRVAICGSLCSVPAVQDLAARHRNISLLGFVEDLGTVIAASKACLSPTHGTGLNIKILDALRHGRPVFASRDAIDALGEGCPDCVFPISSSQLSQILDDPHALSTARSAALSFYSRFTRDGDLVNYASFLRQLALSSAIRSASSSPCLTPAT